MPKLRVKTFDQLESDEFPMLCAFRTLNNSLSNTAQSAPGCTSLFTEVEWHAMEARMSRMLAKQFVDMALGLDQDDQVMERFFPGWRMDWE